MLSKNQEICDNKVRQRNRKKGSGSLTLIRIVKIRRKYQNFMILLNKKTSIFGDQF